MAGNRPRRAGVPLVAVALALLLSGCAGSTATLAGAALVSAGINAVSYVTTDKLATDHAVSMVRKQDCSTVRVLEGGEYCHPKDGETAPAMETATAMADGADRYCYRSLGAITCHLKPDPLRGSEGLVR
jgi:hypothetical protein